MPVPKKNETLKSVQRMANAASGQLPRSRAALSSVRMTTVVATTPTRKLVPNKGTISIDFATVIAQQRPVLGSVASTIQATKSTTAS